MGYQDFTAEDFIQDESFIKWVKEGKSDPENFWSNWLAQNPEKKAIVEEARIFIKNMEFEKAVLPTSRKSALLVKIHAKMDTPMKVQEPQQRKVKTLWTYGSIAAAVVVLLLLFFNQNFLFGPKNTFETSYGESKEISLPDGSQVILNANSQLTVNENWEQVGFRSVKLKGEAFFSISSAAKSGGKKFVVQVGDRSIEVLGTQFNVKQRPDKFQVVLTEGKVRVTQEVSEKEQTATQTVILNPGQMANFDTDTQKLLSQAVNTEVYTSWKSKELFFDFTPLNELVDILKYNYGYEVQLEDPEILQKKLSGTLPYGNPETLIKGVSKVFNLEIISLGEKKIAIKAIN